MDIYQVVKLILTIIFVIAGLLAFISLVRWLVMLLSKNPDRQKRNNIAKVILISFVIEAVALFAHFIAAVKQYSRPIDISTLPTFSVISGDLHDGKWDERIGAKHGNLSPELSWDRFSSAEKYAIVMIDHDGNDWLHWLSVVDDSANMQNDNNINDNSVNVGGNNHESENNDIESGNISGDRIIVPSGSFNDIDSGYVGPYPPSGTHNYTVYVFALQGEPDAISAGIDKGGTDLQALIDKLNISYITDYNNILAVGIVEGSYSSD